MSLVQYAAWPAMGHWQRDLDRWFDGFYDEANASASSRWQPRVDVLEYEDHFELRADLPGVDPAAVDISVQEGQLQLTGERKRLSEAEGLTIRRVESRSGQFSRVFQLPDNVDVEAVTATSEHGVIVIHVPKRSRPQAIKVQVAA